MATNIAAILLFSFYFSLTTGRSLNENQWILATATYTRGGSQAGGGACGYSLEAEERPEWMWELGRKTAAVSGELFRRGGVCGSCFELRCVDHILYCLRGSPSVVVTAVDFCAPNYGLSSDDGGWCNFPRRHFDLSLPAFASIARAAADIVPVQYRRVRCERSGKMRFTVRGSSYFYQVLITNVGFDGEVAEVKVKGKSTGWIPMGRNWGQNWHCNADLNGQPLSFEVTGSSGRRVTSYNIAPSNWRFGQTFEGKQFEG
ncbi:expansin-A16 [Dendrobium catenatum]|uniref:Expansin n=1 Tax=Dendrobium catenatum TaxID=906689 RepID=A0A2I0WLF8_9ASPA|nr:expansin-A16 [Dendrobium catenatum]PKU76492.1 Expansin-A16 [Dendrobium catenatum]